jgi:hypothetical protein
MCNALCGAPTGLSAHILVAKQTLIPHLLIFGQEQSSTRCLLAVSLQSGQTGRNPLTTSGARLLIRHLW